MLDTREKLSHLSIALHWLIGLTMIGMVAFGMYVADLHPTDEAGKAVRIGYLNLHKSIGMLVLVFAAWRLTRRMRQGLPQHIGTYKAWELMLSKVVHIFLLFATVALPLTGILNSVGNTRAVSVFGFQVIPQLLTEKNAMLAWFGKQSHDVLGKLVILAVVLHVLGALKHHFVDKDGTIKRMLGARVTPNRVA
jgi:cytochrome b561